jgi:hypothetical protein
VTDVDTLRVVAGFQFPTPTGEAQTSAGGQRHEVSSFRRGLPTATLAASDRTTESVAHRETRGG